MISSCLLVLQVFSYTTRRILLVRSPLAGPQESIIQEIRSFAEGFVLFLLSSDQTVSANFAMLPTGSSASGRQCHSLHDS